MQITLPTIAIPPDTPAADNIMVIKNGAADQAETKKSKHDDGGRA